MGKDPTDDRFDLLNPEKAHGADVLQLARVVSVGRKEEARGVGKAFYSVDVVTYPGTRRFFNVPVLSPYVRGPYGFHIGVRPGAHCIVGLLGGMNQAYVLGFVSLQDDDGKFAGGGRPAIGADDILIAVPGIEGRDIFSFLYMSATGLFLIKAADDAQRLYDPTNGAIEDVARNYRLVMPSGSLSWTESPLPDRCSFYRRTVFERARSGPLGEGSFVDLQMGTVPVATPAGTQLDPAKKLLYRLNFGGKFRTQSDRDGNVSVVGAGTLDIDLTRKGETAPKITGVSSLANPLTGKTLSIVVGGLTYPTFSIVAVDTSLPAIAREIQENVADVVSGIDSTGAIFVQALETGLSVTLTISGTAASPLGLASTKTGTAGTANDQDVSLKIAGGVTVEVGKDLGTRRAVRLTMAPGGETILDVLGKIVVTLDEQGNPKLVATGKLDIECDEFNLKAAKESQIEVPSLKIGKVDLADTLLQTQKFLAKHNTERATIAGHLHPETGATTSPSAELVSLVTPIAASEVESKVKVDT